MDSMRPKQDLAGSSRRGPRLPWLPVLASTSCQLPQHVSLLGSVMREKEAPSSKVTFPPFPCSPRSVIEIRVSLQHQKRDQSNRIKHEKLLVAASLFLNEAAWQLPSQNTSKYW